MSIILLQEDSMSGGCVFYVRRDVLSEKFSILNVGLIEFRLQFQISIQMIYSNQKSK